MECFSDFATDVVGVNNCLKPFVIEPAFPLPIILVLIAKLDKRAEILVAFTEVLVDDFDFIARIVVHFVEPQFDDANGT